MSGIGIRETALRGSSLWGVVARARFSPCGRCVCFLVCEAAVPVWLCFWFLGSTVLVVQGFPFDVALCFTAGFFCFCDLVQLHQLLCFVFGCLCPGSFVSGACGSIFRTSMYGLYWGFPLIKCSV